MCGRDHPGDPFTTADARRLATLGTVLIVGGTLLPLVQDIALGAVLRPLALDAPTSWSLDLWPAMTGILVGFLAEVSSRGARLREDVEGLVQCRRRTPIGSSATSSELLERSGMTLSDLAREVGVTVVNLSVLKDDRARAVRFSTLTAICDVLGCQPGDVLSVAPAQAPAQDAVPP